MTMKIYLLTAHILSTAKDMSVTVGGRDFVQEKRVMKLTENRIKKCMFSYLNKICTCIIIATLIFNFNLTYLEKLHITETPSTP